MDYDLDLQDLLRRFEERRMSGRPVDPRDMEEFSIKSNRWDQQDMERLMQELPDFRKGKRALGEHVDFASAMWQDTMMSFYKAVPERIPDPTLRPTHRINGWVGDQMRGLKEYEHLRDLGTIGDEAGAAMATMAMRKDLETIHDRLKTEREQAQSLEEMQQDLASLEQQIEEMLAREQMDPDELKQMLQNAENLIDGMGGLQAEMQEGLDSQQQAAQGQLRGGLRDAAEDAQKAQDAAAAYGVEPGSLQRMSPTERMELAKALDNDKLRKIAELFGPMKRLMMSEQRRKVIHARDEVYAIGRGNDLGRVLPAQFAEMAHPLRKLDFYRKFSEAALLQYELRGTEKVGRGGMVICVDSSSSMHGAPEMWSKAVTLCFLNLARTQKRIARVIIFGADREIWTKDFPTEADHTPQNLIDVASFAFMGGTSFTTPLALALKFMQEENARTAKVQSDIVFITDGQAPVPNQFQTEFKAEQERLGFTVYACAIGVHRSAEPLHTLSDGKVFTVSDLTSGGDLREIFSAIQPYQS